MNWIRVLAFLMGALGCSCSFSAPEVDLCQVLKDAPKFEAEIFKADIIAIPGDHGTFATGSGCSSLLIQLADSSLAGAASLQMLGEQIQLAFRMRSHQHQLPLKGVQVHVTARIDKLLSANSPRPSYVLRLL